VKGRFALKMAVELSVWKLPYKEVSNGNCNTPLQCSEY
jgi:hypothetical protein